MCGVPVSTLGCATAGASLRCPSRSCVGVEGTTVVGCFSPAPAPCGLPPPGGVEQCRKAILVDFCRHAFDGSGADSECKGNGKVARCSLCRMARLASRQLPPCC